MPSNRPARPGRQPVSANMLTTKATSSMSPSGYARLIAICVALPPVLESTAPNTSAAPKEATASPPMSPSSHKLFWNSRIRERMISTSATYAAG